MGNQLSALWQAKPDCKPLIFRVSVPDARDFNYNSLCNHDTKRCDLKPRVSLRVNCPPIALRGNRSSLPMASTVEAATCLIEYQSLRRIRSERAFANAKRAADTRHPSSRRHVVPSTSYLLRSALELEGLTVEQGVAPSLRDCFKSVSAYGIVDGHHESDDASSDIHEDHVFRSTPLRLCYARVQQTVCALKQALHDDCPVAFGLTMYQSMDNVTTLRTGRIFTPTMVEPRHNGGDTVLVSSNVACSECRAYPSTPPPPESETATGPCDHQADNDNDAAADANAVSNIEAASSSDSEDDRDLEEEKDRFIGGVSMVLVGYDDEQKLFMVRTPFGAAWGDGGYGYLPYEYVCNPGLATDFWTLIETAEGIKTESPAC